MSAIRQKNRSILVGPLVVLASVLTLISVAQCSPPPPATTTGHSAEAPHEGVVYYSEREGIPSLGALYLYDLGSGEERRLTREQDLVTFYTGFDWSPTAKKLVYVGGTGTQSEIYTVDTTGKERQRLTYNNIEESSPIWSPDGTKISFGGRGEKPGDQALRTYIMNADGSGLQLLFDDPNSAGGPVLWSPDGGRMAVAISILDGQAGQAEEGVLVVLDAARSEVFRTAMGEGQLAYKWSSDSGRLGFITIEGEHRYLNAVDMNTRVETRLRETTSFHTMDWSPDSHRLVYAKAEGDAMSLYITRDDGTEMVKLVGYPRYAVHPAWSPDEKRIAFAASDSKTDGAQFEIFVMDLETGKVRKITQNSFPDLAPRWMSW